MQCTNTISKEIEKQLVYCATNLLITILPALFPILLDAICLEEVEIITSNSCLDRVWKSQLSRPICIMYYFKPLLKMFTEWSCLDCMAYPLQSFAAHTHLCAYQQWNQYLPGYRTTNMKLADTLLCGSDFAISDNAFIFYYGCCLLLLTLADNSCTQP